MRMNKLLAVIGLNNKGVAVAGWTIPDTAQVSRTESLRGNLALDFFGDSMLHRHQYRGESGMKMDFTPRLYTDRHLHEGGFRRGKFNHIVSEFGRQYDTVSDRYPLLANADKIMTPLVFRKRPAHNLRPVGMSNVAG